MPIVEQLQADREKQLERQKTIEENIGLVHACAHRFQGKGIEYDDLFQAGCMGLVKATDAFDTGRGVRFSTYAVPVILGEMRRLFRDGGTVKVSRSLKELGDEAQPLPRTVCPGARAGSDHHRAGTAAAGDPGGGGGGTGSQQSAGFADQQRGTVPSLNLPVSSPEELLSDILSLRQMLERLEERNKS